MDSDAHTRAQRIRAFTDRLPWRHAPGVYAWPVRPSLAVPYTTRPEGVAFGHTLGPKDELPHDAVETLRRILDNLPQVVLEAVVDDIAARVWQFRLDRIGQATPNGRAFRAWVNRAVPRLREFEHWLSRDPLPTPVAPDPNGDALAQLTWQRRHVLEQIGRFREWLADTYNPQKPAERPIDVPKSDLVDGIGETLWIAGCDMKNSEGGVFANVLRAVLGALDELGPDTVHVRGLMRPAFKMRPHWRNVPG
jgi:hypothetical protein